MIVAIDKVQQAVQRALQLDPGAGSDAAIAATAQALGLPVEAVRAAVETEASPC